MLMAIPDWRSHVSSDFSVSFAYLYGTGNPYVSLLRQALESQRLLVRSFRTIDIALGRVDIVHMHWVDRISKASTPGRRLVGLFRLGLIFFLGRLRSIPIVWTIHNLIGKESRSNRSDWVLSQILPLGVTGWVSLSPVAQEEAIRAMPKLKRRRHLVVPHGHYRDAYPPIRPKAEARAELGLPLGARVLLFFGRVRDYKAVPELIQAFSQLSEDDCWLVIAGDIARDELADYERLIVDTDRILLVPRRIDEGEVPTFFGAADVCVFPARESLNSGTALLSLSFDRPLLAARTGSLIHLNEQFGDRWVRLYDGILSGSILDEALEEARLDHDHLELISHDWQQIASALIAFYRELMGREP